MKLSSMSLFVCAATALIAVPTARADQCQWVDPDVGARAARLVREHPEIAELCEPCGDVVPTPPRTVTKVAVEPAGDGGSTLAVDGEWLDLAYVYVRTSERLYTNLAALAGCPASGVSPSLRIDAETPTGVLIVAERAQAASAVAPGDARAVTRAIHDPAPVIYMVAPPWPDGVIVLLSFGATLSVLAVAGLCLFGRRRKDHAPRATRLDGARPPRSRDEI